MGDTLTRATHPISDTSQPPALQPDSVSPSRPRLHLDYLDGLRAIAALFVACYHSYLAVYIHTRASGISRWIAEPMLYGHLAVPLFIVISGFCLMLPVVRDDGVLRGGATFFFRKRAWRILPTYYLALLLFLAAHHFENHHIPNARDVVTHLLLIHNLWPDTFRGNINPSFWSIAVEWQIYFAFPLLVRAWRSYGGIPTLIVTLVGSILIFFALYDTSLRGITPHFYGLFAIGMFGSCVAFSADPAWRVLRERVRWGWGAAAMLIAGVAVSRLWGPGTEVGYQVCALDLFMGVTAMCVLIAAARRRESPLTRLLSWRPLAAMGAFSYSLYLLHQPCLHMVLRVFQRFGGSDNAHYLALTFVGVPIIVAMAYVFYLCCERPFVQAKARLKSDVRKASAGREEL